MYGARAAGPTMDGAPEIVPLSLIEESRVQMPDSTHQQSADATSSGEALTVMVNGCKVVVNNNAGRDVIYHTISAFEYQCFFIFGWAIRDAR